MMVFSWQQTLPRLLSFPGSSCCPEGWENTQHICNLLRHHRWDALTSWIDISAGTSPRHFNVNMFGSEHIISQNCSSSSVFHFSEWPYHLQVTESRSLGLALCFPPLPIPRPAYSCTLYFLRWPPLHHHSLSQSRVHHFPFFPLNYYKNFLFSDFNLALSKPFSTLQPQ